MRGYGLLGVLVASWNWWDAIGSNEDVAVENLFIQRLYPSSNGSPSLESKESPQFSILASLDVRMTSVQSVRGNDPNQGYHFDVFPKELGKLMLEFPVESFTAALVGGRWKSEHWGVPPVDMFPTGGSLVAKFDGTDDTELSWTRLTHTLGGLLCASFGSFVDPRRHSIVPRSAAWDAEAFWGGYSENMTFNSSSSSSGRGDTVYGTLPTEAMCTENLAPLGQLLPCRLETGLAFLFEPVALAGNEFRMIRLSASRRRIPSGDGESSSVLVELTVTLTTVFRSSKSADDLGEHFFSRLRRFQPCVATSQSRVFVRVPIGAAIDSNRSATMKADNFSRIDVYDPSDISRRLPQSVDERSVEVPLNLEIIDEVFDECSDIQVWRDEVLSATDIDTSIRSRSNWVVSMRNKHPTTAKYIRYHETLPTFMRPLLHTLTAVLAKIPSQTQGGAVEPQVAGVSVLRQSAGAAVLNDFGISWEPTDSLRTPSAFHFESILLPPRTSFTLRFDVLKVHLHQSQYGHSPDKGEDIGSGLLIQYPSSQFKWHGPEKVEHQNNKAENMRSSFVFTDGLIVLVPLPDLSMPFNVVAISCTALLLLVGAFFRLTIVRLPLHEEYDKIRLSGDSGGDEVSDTRGAEEELEGHIAGEAGKTTTDLRKRRARHDDGGS